MRIRLVLFAAMALVAIIPITIFAVLQVSKTLETELEEVVDWHLLLAKNVGHALQRYDRDLRAIFLHIAIETISGEEPNDIDQVVKGFHIRHICVTRRDDPAIVYTATIDSSPCPQQVQAERFAMFQALAQEGEVKYSPALPSPSGEPTIYMVAPIGDLLAIGAIETTYFVQLGMAISFGEKGHAAIVDQKGHVLAHPSPIWRQEIKDISKVAPVKRMLAGETGISQFFSPALKADMISGFTTVPRTGWGVMIPQPMSELEAKADGAKLFALITILAGLVVASALSWIISGLLTRPVKAVAEAARTMASGDLRARVTQFWRPRELSDLAASFNDMATSLEDSVRQQNEAREQAETIGNRLSAIFDHAPAILAIKDTEGRFLHSGRHACEVIGRPEEQVLGRTVHELLSKEAADRHTKQDRETLRTGASTEQIVPRQTPRGMRDYFIVKFPILGKDRQPAGIGVVGIDVTEQRRAEAELRQSEARLVEAQRRARLGSWDRDLETGTVSCSAEMCRLFGLPSDTTAVTLEMVLEKIHPSDRPDVASLIKSKVRDGGSFEIDFRVVTPEGDSRHIRVQAEVILGDDGAPRRTAGTAQDVTELRQLEEQVRQAHKMEAVGNLTGGLAHEFNNLLMVVRGNLELLQNRVGDDKVLGRYLTFAMAGADRGADLTNRLLAFARKQPLRPEACDLNDIVQGMQDVLRQTLGETITIDSTLSEDLWPSRIDRGLLENALLNLAINARDAMPEGGGITISTANETLDRRMAEALSNDLSPGDYVKVSVSDTGCGMSEATIAQSFEPFFTTKDAGKGTGLGLSMVYGFAKQSEGHADIDSKLGKGTTVHLYLPRADVGIALPSARAAPLTTAAPGRTILVVEDDEGVREVVVSMLEDLGHHVVATKNGSEALNVLAGKKAFDLLFSDVVMPGGLMGWQLAEAAKAIHPHLKVLLTTGHDLRDVAGGDDMDPSMSVLRKPYQKASLQSRIEDLIENGDRLNPRVVPLRRPAGRP